MPETVTAAELGEILGVTPQRVSQLHREGMPRIAKGRYDPDICQRWLAAKRGQSDLFNEGSDETESSTLVSPQILADRLGVTPQRIAQMVHEGMPRVARGKYDLDACLQWATDTREDMASGGETSAEITAKRARYYQLQGDLLAHKLERERGQVVNTGTAIAVFSESLREIKEIHEAWVEESAGPAERNTRQELSWRVLERCADLGADLSGRLASAGDIAAASLRKRRPVG